MEKPEETYKNILSIVVGFGLISFLFEADWLLKTVFVIGFVSSVSSWVAQKISWLWMQLSWLLSMIMPNILLSIIFYLFLTPVALLSRMFGNKNQLILKNTGNSTFIDKKTAYTKESFEKLW